jgi:hypothetical protein
VLCDRCGENEKSRFPIGWWRNGLVRSVFLRTVQQPQQMGMLFMQMQQTQPAFVIAPMQSQQA